MKPEIEVLDKRRMRLLEWHLIGFAAFIVLSVARFFFRLNGLNSQPVGIAVLMGLILCVVIIASCTIGFAMINAKAMKDPALGEALRSELIQSLEVHSWKAAFIGAVATTVFFAFAGFFYPECDPVMVALTSIIAGAGSYHASFYFRYRSS